MRSVVWVGFAGLVASALVGCGDSGDGAGGAGGGGTGGGANADVNFHEHVEPLLQQHCLGCHSAGRIGGFSLATFEEAEPMAGFMAGMVEAKLMPPWGAHDTEDCAPTRPFADDLRLSDEEIAVFRAWADAGAPQGDPAKAPPPFELSEPGLANVDLELVPDAPSVVEGDTDLFTCVVYDPALTETRFVDGIHFVADNATVTHHALAFRVPRDEGMARAGGNERFECFGAPPGELILGWAPGGIPLEMPANVGIELGADDLIIVQMHYHPTGTSTEEDASSIQLRFMDESPAYQFLVSLPGNARDEGDGLLPGENDAGGAEFRIPAGATNHVEEMEIVVPEEVAIDLPILLVATHMHYVGRDMRVEIERANPPAGQAAQECLVQTPQWDFNWQRFYEYDVPISDLPTARAGDIIRLTCTYDNTMANPFLKKALEDQGMSAPIDVTLGEQTLDEMCLAGVGILVPNF